MARQMHQKTVKHYWVNIVKQQVTGGERRKQRGVWTKSASKGQHVGFVVMSTDTFGKF